MAYLFWKNTVVLQQGWPNGEFFDLKKKSNISWEWRLKRLLQKSVRIRNHQSRNSAGRGLVVKVERGFLGLVESQRERGPVEASMQSVQAGGFRSEVFSEWAGRKRGVGLVKRWERLYLNTEPAQKLGGLGSGGEDQVLKKCVNNEIFLIYFFFSFRDSLWQLLSECATL